jgi:hypothetical protein
MFLSWNINVSGYWTRRRERKAMNGETRKSVALSALALGVGVALGAVLGNDKTRKSLVDKGNNWFNNHRKKQ